MDERYAATKLIFTLVHETLPPVCRLIHERFYTDDKMIWTEDQFAKEMTYYINLARRAMKRPYRTERLTPVGWYIKLAERVGKPIVIAYGTRAS